MSDDQIPLFPLNTVLFPNGPLSLRIFEPRYLDMIKECSAQSSEFGVCLIEQGREAGQPAVPAMLGTTARIVDFFTMEDGILGIRAAGIDRFQVQATTVRDNGLLIGEIARLPEEEAAPLETDYLLLRTVLERMLEQVGTLYPGYGERELSDATWVGYRLAELLPLELEEKQSLLEMEDAVGRLRWITAALPRFQAEE